MADYLVTPTFETRKYNAKECVAIRDRWQQYLYIKNGAYPVDMYVSDADKNLVMVFDKVKTYELYQKYRKYELE